MEKSGNELDRAWKELGSVLPPQVASTLETLLQPRYRWARIPVGLLLVVTGMFGFLPILGYEFIPVGLFLLAQDIPILQKPVGLFILGMLHIGKQLLCWWKKRNGVQKAITALAFVSVLILIGAALYLRLTKG